MFLLLLRNRGPNRSGCTAVGAGPLRSKQMSLIRPGREMACEFRSVEQSIHVNSGFVSHAIQKRNEILGGHVATRSGTIRAATESCGRAIKLANAGLQTCQRIRECPSIGIVKMERQLARRNFELLLNERKGFADLIRERHAIRVAKGHPPGTLFASSSNGSQ